MTETANTPGPEGPQQDKGSGGFNAVEIRLNLIQAIRAHKTLFYVEAALMIVAGLVAILLPHIATLAAGFFLGWLLLVLGILGVFVVWSRRASPGVIWAALSVVLALAAGIVILAFPTQALVSLTFILAIFFVAEGAGRLAFAWQMRHSGGGWGWLALSGLLGVVLGIVIVAALPKTSTWVIGLLVGINLLLYGIGLMRLVATVDKMED